VVILDSQDVNDAFQHYNKGYNELLANGVPRELSTQQLVVNTPNGRAFLLGFLWSSDDHEEGRAYLAEIEALGSAVLNTVESKTIAEYSEGNSQMVPPNAYGTLKSLNIRKMTPEAVAVMGRNVEKMPSALGVALSIHELRGPSTAPSDQSVLGSREPHFVLELVSDSRSNISPVFQMTYAAIPPQNLSRSITDSILLR
jgi:hypothetical protein